MDADKITTITQIIKSGVLVLGMFGVNISPESTTIILTAAGSIYALAGMIQGWFTNKKVD